MAKKGSNEIATLIKVLEKGTKDKSDITIDDIISNPVSCGYLLDFCQKGVRCLAVVCPNVVYSGNSRTRMFACLT